MGTIETVNGCEGSFFTFQASGNVDTWQVTTIPCITQAPATANAGDTITLAGQNFMVDGSTVDVLVGGTAVKPASTGTANVAFVVPQVNGDQKVQVHLTRPSGVVTSNTITISVKGSAITPASLKSITDAMFNLNGALAPCSIATAWGANLVGSPATTAPTSSNMTTGIPWDTKVAGTEVLFNGKPAPMSFAYTRLDDTSQINFQIPCDAAGAASVQITRFDSTGQTVATVSNALPVTIVSASPVLFGGSNYPLIAQDAMQGLALNSPTSPAKRGDWIILWATGLGVTSPPIASGNNAASLGSDHALGNKFANVVAPIQVYLNLGNGVYYSMNMQASVASPEFPGVYQVVFEIPPEMPLTTISPKLLIKAGAGSYGDNATTTFYLQ